jgi:hypothetical protein
MHKLKYLPILLILVMMSVSLASPSTNVSASRLQAIAPSLGAAVSFSVLGGQSVTNTGPSVVGGDLGVSPGTSITGFPPGIVNGAIHQADPVALQAQADVVIAYDQLAGQACNTDLTGQDLGGMTLVEGVYCFTSAAQLTGQLTLDAQGNSAAVWVFQIASQLNTASSASVLIINGGGPCNVFWQVGSSATLGTGNTFVGNILALTSISLATNTNVSGRALARNGSVTMDSNNISNAACGVAVPTATATSTGPTATETPTSAPPTATSTSPAATSTSTGPTATATTGPAPTATNTQAPPAPTATNLPAVTALPGTGGAPIRNDISPWGLVIAGGLSAIALFLGIQAYRKTSRPRQ